MGRTAVNRWILWQVVFALCARCVALGAYCTVYVIVVILLPGLHFPTTHSGRVGRRCATPCLPSAQYWSSFLFSLSWLPGPQQISHSPKGARKRIITITYVLRTVHIRPRKLRLIILLQQTVCPEHCWSVGL